MTETVMRKPDLFQSLLAASFAALTFVTAAAAQGRDSERWQALFAAIPPLPADAAAAVSKISTSVVDGRVRIGIADPGLRSLQRDVDELFAPPSQQSAAQFQQRLKEINDDPGMQRLARKLDDAMRPATREGKPPTREEMRKMQTEVEKLLGPCATTRAGCPPPPQSEIAAYRLELMRQQPRSGQLYQQLFDMRRRFAQQHAEADRAALARIGEADAASVARELVERHHALARQQLAETTTLHAQARDTLGPRLQRMAELTRAAEGRNASVGERVQGYSVLKGYIELLLTLQRETLQDVGFWAGVRPRSLPANALNTGRVSLYELIGAPEVELSGNGVLPTAGPYYPEGRAIVVDLPPGIR
jgi:hypothetical protein